VFGAARIFSQISNETGLSEWFFMAREGVFGPYQSKEVMLKALNDFVEHKIKTTDDGGRSAGKHKLSLEPLEHDYPIVYDSSKRKKGLND
jgi:hypothetical protein